eukprot:1403822-Prymnesium_polylepis.3
MCARTRAELELDDGARTRPVGRGRHVIQVSSRWVEDVHDCVVCQGYHTPCFPRSHRNLHGGV